MTYELYNGEIQLEFVEDTHEYFVDGEKIMISGSLKEYENMLGESNFLRVHQSHLINLDKIKKYVKGSGGHVVMSDDSMIGIARSKKQEFLERVAQHNS